MTDFESLARQLARVDHFRGLSIKELVRIISLGCLQRCQSGKVIFVEDDPSTGMYVLLSGRVQLCKLGPQGQVSILSVLEPVIMFNEVSAVDGGPNPATAICLDDSLLWRLASSDLEALVLRYPPIGWGVLKVMAKRNRHLVSKFQDLSFRTVLSRTAKLLLDLSNAGTRPIDRRTHPNHLMAAQIATVPEAFSRCLKALRTFGDIQTEARFIHILNPEHLSKIAQTSLDTGE